MWKRVGMSQDLTISDAEPGDAPRREGSRSRQTSRVGEKNGPSGTSLLKALRDDHETLLELMTSTPCSSSWQAKQSKAFQKRLEAANSAVSAAADVVRFSSLYYTGRMPYRVGEVLLLRVVACVNEASPNRDQR